MTACAEVCSWQDPQLGLHFVTTFLGRALEVIVPEQRDLYSLLYSQPRIGPAAWVGGACTKFNAGTRKLC